MDPLDVVAAVIVDGDRVLACRRREGKADAGRWEFPGGKVEPGESPAEALVREIHEELGIGIRIDRELRTDTTEVRGRGIRLTCLRATIIGPRPTTSTDHDRLEWVRLTELHALEWTEPDLPMVAQLAGS